MKVGKQPLIQQFVCELKQMYYSEKNRSTLKGRHTAFEKKWHGITTFTNSKKDTF